MRKLPIKSMRLEFDDLVETIEGAATTRQVDCPNRFPIAKCCLHR